MSGMLCLPTPLHRLWGFFSSNSTPAAAQTPKMQTETNFP